jgi:succinate dehydrogenase flavin-adding protein (antitoxin of CptAB toxin-antitoxin module)
LTLSLYNYADDNTLSYSSTNYDELITVLESESNILIDWFYCNCMQANPETDMTIVMHKRFQIGHRKTVYRSECHGVGSQTLWRDP